MLTSTRPFRVLGTQESRGLTTVLRGEQKLQSARPIGPFTQEERHRRTIYVAVSVPRFWPEHSLFSWRSRRSSLPRTLQALQPCYDCGLHTLEANDG